MGNSSIWLLVLFYYLPLPSVSFGPLLLVYSGIFSTSVTKLFFLKHYLAFLQKIRTIIVRYLHLPHILVFFSVFKRK